MSQDSESSTISDQPLGSAVNERVRLLARGEWLLKRLHKEAEAARAEARHAELQRLLADARMGDDRELQVWLRQHDNASVAADNIADRNEPAVDTRSIIFEEPAVTSEPVAWDDYLPAARRRQRERALQLEARRAAPQRTNRATPIGVAPSSGRRQLRADKPLKSHPGKRVKETLKERARQAASAMPDPLSAGAISAMKLNVLAKSFNDAELDEQQSQHKKTLLFFRVGGLSASIVLHIVILIVLAVLTIKLPPPPANLALESSDASSEVFELSEKVDVAEPLQPDVGEPIPEMEIDISQDLASISDMTSSISQSVRSPAAGIASAAMVANASESGAGPPVKDSSFFGAAASGNCFCYVIDSSSSMKGGPWEAAKAELLRSLASLKAKQRFYIIFFNQDLTAIPMPGEREPARRALYATPENVEHARRWIDTIRIAKGAPPADAMELAVDLEPDAIYLLTDGVTKTDLPGFLREINRTVDLIDGEQVRVPIHAIAFYSLAGQKLMQQVARENRGQFIYVPDPSKK